MRKFFTSAVTALTIGAAVLAAAAPAEAQRYRHSGHRGHSGNDVAVAAVAGIAGLALGSALSSRSNGGGYYSRPAPVYRNGYSYDPRYDSYGGGYYEERYEYAPPRVCISSERVWDPYIQRRVTIERRYPC